MAEPGDEERWDEATFEGASRAQRRRWATWTPQERLEWLDAAVLEAHRTGALAASRERKQREVERAWRATDGH